MNASNLAALALEVWRSSGERTIERLLSTVSFYAQTYWGPSHLWGPATKAEADRAAELAQAGTRAWEVK